MAAVDVTESARNDFEQLPQAIRRRALDVFRRLESWPAVSGAKPLRGKLKGNFRVRTGDYRVIFRVEGDTVIVWKIGYRGEIYD